MVASSTVVDKPTNTQQPPNGGGSTVRKMRFTIDCGHCTKSGTSDTGCTYNGWHEEKMTREIGYPLRDMLVALGHEVKLIDLEYAGSVNESLGYRQRQINSFNPDLAVSIHINAGGGVGTEVLSDMEAYTTPYVNKVLDEFVKLGFRRRGIVDGREFAVVGRVNPHAMLIECCFIDTSDMNKYNPQQFAKAICSAIGGATPSTDSGSHPSGGNSGTEYSESGVFYPSGTIYFRNSPSMTASIQGTYGSGENVAYDKVAIAEGYVWISWVSSNGTRRYMPIRQQGGAMQGSIS